MTADYHLPVLLRESVEGLAIRSDGVYADATFGGGGHSRLIINELGDNGRLFGFDQDEDAKANAAAFLSSFGGVGGGQFTFVAANFRFLKKMLRLEGVRNLDGILADLGVSSHQFDTAERGFSYRFDAELDMRMNQSAGETAADLLNRRSADELQTLFSTFGEVRNAKTLAAAIVRHREKSTFRTTGDLLRICEANLMGERMRYLSQVFQALRMSVNDETSALADFLVESLDILRPGGRLVVITYHSIEDRMVKNFMKTGNIEGRVEKDFFGNITRPMEILTKKAIEASHDEVRKNPRARSAKLRIAVKK